MRNEILNQSLHRRSINVLLGPSRGSSLHAHVGLFVRHEFGVRKHRPVFEIINSQRDRLRPRDRTKMPGQFQLVRVRFLDGRAQFFAGDVHVRFERGHAFRGPVVHHALRVVHAGQFMHLRENCRRAFQIRRGRINGRPRHQACVYTALHFQIGVRLQASGRAHGGYAGR